MFDGAVSAIYTGTVTDAPPERKKKTEHLKGLCNSL